MPPAILYFPILLLVFHVILPLADPSSDLSQSPPDKVEPWMKKLSEKDRAIVLRQTDPELRKSLKSIFDTGFDTGFETGYENRSSEYFLAMFECAIQHGKTTLEVYKDYQNIYSRCEQHKDVISKLKLPDDILNLIENNDHWIAIYEGRRISNGYFTTPNGPVENPFESCIIPVLFDIYKQFKHWYCIVNYTAPNAIVRSSKTTPPAFTYFLRDLKLKLRDIQSENSAKYPSEHDVFVRFAAHCGRTYKMFCTVHHRLLKYISETAHNNKTVQFTDILFYFVPYWMITPEQLLFFNVVHTTLYPTMPPIKNFTISNPNLKCSKDTLIPYDDSTKCNQYIKRNTEISSSTKEIPKVP